MIMNWSPDGKHLLIGEFRMNSSEENFCHLSVLRFFPKQEVLKVLNLENLSENYFSLPHTLVGRYLWLDKRTFILPCSNSEYRTVRLKANTIEKSGLKKWDAGLGDGKIFGGFIALPEIKAAAYFEDCSLGTTLRARIF